MRLGPGCTSPRCPGDTLTLSSQQATAPNLPAHVKQGGYGTERVEVLHRKMFPPEYANRIFIAQHGSWNRSKKSGYRVIMVTLKDNKVDKSEVFAEGWMENERVWGRPVDLLVLSDGSLLISDDHANVVYRVTYGGR